MRRMLLLLCVALGGPQTAVAAEDYTKAVNAAWCAGAFAKSIKGLRASGKALDLKFARSVEALFNHNFAFAKGYFRENDDLTSFILRHPPFVDLVLGRGPPSAHMLLRSAARLAAI